MSPACARPSNVCAVEPIGEALLPGAFDPLVILWRPAGDRDIAVSRVLPAAFYRRSVPPDGCAGLRTRRARETDGDSLTE